MQKESAFVNRVGEISGLVPAIFFPDEYLNTVVFSRRWLPYAAVLFLLGAPAPLRNSKLLNAYCLTCAAAFFIGTAITWRHFEERELSGLQNALESLPKEKRLLGLSFIEESDRIKGQPFIQTFAYAQAMQGADLNFSWAEHASALVQFKEARNPGWTNGLEWNPERVQERDFLYFDYALVNARPQVHDFLVSIPHLNAVTEEGRWRLYEVTPNAP